MSATVQDFSRVLKAFLKQSNLVAFYCEPEGVLL